MRKDPFASNEPMEDNHPVMVYLNWQIEAWSDLSAEECGLKIGLEPTKFSLRMRRP